MRPDSISLYSAGILPLLLMYLLVILRMIERRQVPSEYRSSVWSILSVRDAALVTLALDLSEVVGSFVPSLAFRESPLQFVIPGALLALHLLVYFLATTRTLHRENPPSNNSLRSILDVYFALTLLMTNAVTLMDIMRALGKGL